VHVVVKLAHNVMMIGIIKDYIEIAIKGEVHDK